MQAHKKQELQGNVSFHPDFKRKPTRSGSVEESQDLGEKYLARQCWKLRTQWRPQEVSDSRKVEVLPSNAVLDLAETEAKQSAAYRWQCP